jgi:hypothetical protein
MTGTGQPRRVGDRVHIHVTTQTALKKHALVPQRNLSELKERLSKSLVERVTGFMPTRAVVEILATGNPVLH